MRTFLASIALLLGGPAQAQDIEAGHHMATIWCARCHAIEPNETGPTLDVAPPFSHVARMASTTSTSLNVFLSTPHPSMPDYAISRQEIADVSAYILSLNPQVQKGSRSHAN